MKRNDLLRHLRRHGCYLKREGGSHSLWTNPATGWVEAVTVSPKYQVVIPRSAQEGVAIRRGTSLYYGQGRLQD